MICAVNQHTRIKCSLVQMNPTEDSITNHFDSWQRRKTRPRKVPVSMCDEMDKTEKGEHTTTSTGVHRITHSQNLQNHFPQKKGSTQKNWYNPLRHTALSTAQTSRSLYIDIANFSGGNNASSHSRAKRNEPNTPYHTFHIHRNPHT